MLTNKVDVFLSKLNSIPHDEVSLAAVAKALFDSVLGSNRSQKIISSVSEFLLKPTNSPDDIGAERRLEIFLGAGDVKTRGAILVQPGVKNAIIESSGYDKYMETAVAAGVITEEEYGIITALNTAMFEAVGRGAIAEIEAAISEGADIRAKKNGMTVAMLAAWYGRLTPELAETLARLGCPMDARDKNGMTVAMRAAWEGHLTPELAETLARLGCPMDARDKDDRTVAMRAAWNGYLTSELAETLARLGCPMDARDTDGWTVAIHAAQEGILTPELAETLAQLGCPMDARCNYGWTVAMWAAFKGVLTPELAEYLSRLGCPMDARDKDGRTVAIHAAQEGILTPELAETLARRGCPMDARDGDGWTVAMYAARCGILTPELAETLARLGCPMDARDKDGRTVAMLAAWNGHLTPELSECLARLGCPMDARDNNGRTTAMRAAESGRLAPEMAETLVRLGCPMDDICIGETAIKNKQFASFNVWKKYATPDVVSASLGQLFGDDDAVVAKVVEGMRFVLTNPDIEYENIVNNLDKVRDLLSAYSSLSDDVCAKLDAVLPELKESVSLISELVLIHNISKHMRVEI